MPWSSSKQILQTNRVLGSHWQHVFLNFRPPGYRRDGTTPAKGCYCGTYHCCSACVAKYSNNLPKVSAQAVMEMHRPAHREPDYALSLGFAACGK